MAPWLAVWFFYKGLNVDILKNLNLFRKTKALESNIDEFLDKLSQAGLSFKLAVRIYLVEGASGEFDEKLHEVNELESHGDHLRRAIEVEMYAQTLIPDFRGDVLGLLENMDSILNLMEGALWSFSIETPDIAPEYHHGYQTLVEMVVLAVESLVLASRAFFRNIDAVSDHMHKVMFYEKEADKVSTRLKRSIFSSELELSQKAHLRYMVEQIDNVADRAEDVADRLAIYTIKRQV